MESKAQKCELSTAGAMSSGGGGLQGRDSVSSERQASPRGRGVGRSEKVLDGRGINSCQQPAALEKAGGAAGSQLEDRALDPEAAAYYSQPCCCPSLAPDLWGGNPV